MTDHLVSGLSRWRCSGWPPGHIRVCAAAARGALALALGLLGIAAGGEAFHYTREVGPSGDDFTGLLCLPAGLVLLVLGALTLWRTRRTEGSLAWRYARRALLGVAACSSASSSAIARLRLRHDARRLAPSCPRTGSASPTRT